MRTLKALLKRLFIVGVVHEQSFTEKRDIIFTNQAVFVLILSSICIGSIETFFGFHFRSIIAFSTILLLLICFYFQKNNQHLLAKTLAILFPFLASVSSTIIFGGEAKTHFYLMATLILGLVVFHKPIYHKILASIHVPVFIAIILYIENHKPLYSGEDSAQMGTCHLVLIFICIYTTLSEFTVHNQHYESKIIQLLESLKVANLVLEEQKEQIETQANELQLSNLILQKEINEKIKAQQKLLASNEELEQYAYVASHDLKEPLRTVGSFIQLLNKKLKPYFDDEASEYQHFIFDGVKRMSSLLDDLLALSRLNKEHDYSAIDLNEVLEEICQNLGNSIASRNGKVIFGQLPTITANKAQMNQLFQNLISNGIKFNKKATPKVAIKYTEKSDHYIFEVKDNGIGIPEEFKEKIFIIFQRLHHRSTYDGTGIGLSICKKIVNNHRGRIWIESLPNNGTSIFFTISKKIVTPEIDYSTN